jgi:glycosyltransferase involved in cell wall biosynthesis
VTNTPLVSICIPTYLGAQTIGATIESVLNQDFTDFELIVVDDGSPDETAAVVRQFSDPRLRYERNEHNLGPVGNWNRCQSLACGKYFKLLPHDDLLAPACLTQQVKVLEEDTDERIALVFCARDVIGPDGRVLTRRGYPSSKTGVIQGNELARRSVRAGTNLIGEPGGVLFRRALSVVVGGFDATNSYVIDLDYWFRLLAHGDAYYLSQCLASFRVSGQQWSVRLGDSQANDFNAFVTRIGPAIGLEWTYADKLISKIASRMNNWMRLGFYLVFLRLLPNLQRFRKH